MIINQHLQSKVRFTYRTDWQVSPCRYLWFLVIIIEIILLVHMRRAHTDIIIFDILLTVKNNDCGGLCTEL